MVLPVRIELTTSPLPRGCSTTELRQLGRGTGYTRPRRLARRAAGPGRSFGPTEIVRDPTGSRERPHPELAPVRRVCRFAFARCGRCLAMESRIAPLNLRAYIAG